MLDQLFNQSIDDRYWIPINLTILFDINEIESIFFYIIVELEIHVLMAKKGPKRFLVVQMFKFNFSQLFKTLKTCISR